MDDDTEMHDGDQRDYSDPNANNPTPYASLLQSDSRPTPAHHGNSWGPSTVPYGNNHDESTSSPYPFTTTNGSTNLSSYPDPGFNSSTPYPALARNGSTPYTSPYGNPYARANSSSTLTRTNDGSINLNDYFKMGNMALRHNSSQRGAAPDDIDLDLTMDDGDNFSTRDDHTSGANLHAEDKAHPWTNGVRSSNDNTASTPLPLPGFHFLPDEDRLGDTEHRYQQDQSTASGTEDSHAPRGRGGSRGRARGRGRGRGGARGGLKLMMKKSLKGTEHEVLVSKDYFKATRLPADEKGRKPRGRKRGDPQRQHIDPGPQFREKSSQATEAFLEGKLDDAIVHACEAIMINPEVFGPHITLAQAKEAQGLKEEALAAMTHAALIKKDPEFWIDVAARYLARDGGVYSMDNVNAAFSCYQTAIKIEEKHFGVRQARMELYRERQAWAKAQKECNNLLSIRPEEVDLLKVYAEMSMKTMGNSRTSFELHGAIQAYEKAFQIYSEKGDVFGDGEDQWSDLNIYMELIQKGGNPETGVKELKRIARWFLGRKQDTFWDDVIADDQEFDEGVERRHRQETFAQGRVRMDPARYGRGLPLELRVKLGELRLQMGPAHQGEALMHFEHLRRMTLEADIEEYFDLFLEVGDFLRDFGLQGAAVNFYDKITVFPDLLAKDFWLMLASCYREVGRHEDAENCYHTIIRNDPNDCDTRAELVDLFDSTNQRMKALGVTTELIKLGRTDVLRKQNQQTYVTASQRVQRKEKSSGKRTNDNGTQASQTQIQMPTRPRRVQQPTRKIAQKQSASWIESQGGQDSARIVEAIVEAVVDEDSTDSDDSDGSNGVAEATADTSEVPSFERGTNYLNSLQEQRGRVTLQYSKVKELWPVIGANEDEQAIKQWMHCATAMVTEFKIIKEFFPTKKRDKYFTGLRTGGDASGRKLLADMEAFKERLQQDGVHLSDADAIYTANEGGGGEFQGISFAEWHRIVSELALRYGKNVDQSRCYDLLQNVLLRANVFCLDTELMNATAGVCLCCGLLFNDGKFMIRTARRLCAEGRYEPSMIVQLIAAAARLGQQDASFYDKHTRKFVSTAVKEQDYLAMTPEMRSKNDWGKQIGRLTERAKQVGDSTTELDPALLTTYAHTLASKEHGHSVSALPYLFHALALQPDNLVINLSIATVQLINAMRKTTKVHQYEIAQGQAFFYRYYNLRIASGKACHIQEAEYNLARMWQLLELPHLAVPIYEKVLKLSGQVQQEQGPRDGESDWETEDYAKEAALALRDILASSGNEEAAKAIAEEWLVI